MKEQEIITGNRLISEFMGGKFWENPSNNHCFKVAPKKMPIELPDILSEGDLKYHSSWEWLMPVIENIGKNFNVRITWCADGGTKGFDVTYIDRPDIYDDISIADYGGFGAITNTWKCAVKFIEWHNKKRKRANR